MRPFTVASLAAGLLLLVGSPLVWWLNQPPTAVGDLDVLATSEPTARDATTERAATDRTPGDDRPGNDRSADDRLRDDRPRDDRPGDDRPAEADTDDASAAPASFAVGPRRGPLVHVAAPERITIPSIGAAAPVLPVGLEADGTMEIPRDVATVGWFEPGVRPGEEGSAVLSGHVDSRTQGPGAFFDLEDLDVGDEVIVEGGRQTRTWRVVARQRFAKDQLPVDDLFTRSGTPRLVLITCGGAFDAGARSYSDNVVVVAEPA
jgi:LPXTG-site transpeptidase (sortase) family protein